MLILGIDPGFAQTGWGVVESNGQRNRPVSFGVIKTQPAMADNDRIHFIAKSVGEIALAQKIAVCGMEDIFFTKNVSSAINVAKVIGAIVHQLAQNSIEVHLFSPMTIKSAVTGYGGADKKQVQEMVRLLLGFQTIPKPDHSADALAAAICYSVYNATQVRMNIT
ncbi:crossover junction endodeoxyribonuclease RuvC [Sphaerochaeta sp. PS]|uniref:crossover junction endodeoxyribonuclease RuvC n=1 Tax=Sphaerochaeta sp. PS TaxID=3076336 RepID=UPI0028A3F04E|nr:crossover junction endodeoxyribonuclease RuvC [Sphaerochaeta sp. PS]MDT4761493.1 crossover junction endodeoxyribonuclease RuvC [Sphaerochaeta sp. PS]